MRLLYLSLLKIVIYLINVYDYQIIFVSLFRNQIHDYLILKIMERIFEAKNEKEQELVQIIKTNSDKNSRKKALQQLLVLNGLDKNDLYSIRSKEVYVRIPNKPPTWMKFWSASIVYDDCLIKR